MTFTFTECFSSDCGYCSVCCRDKEGIPFVSPFDDVFSNTQDPEMKNIITKVKRLKHGNDRYGDIHLILKWVMDVRYHKVYIPLEKRIQKVKNDIENDKKNNLL